MMFVNVSQEALEKLKLIIHNEYWCFKMIRTNKVVWMVNAIVKDEKNNDHTHPKHEFINKKARSKRKNPIRIRTTMSGFRGCWSLLRSSKNIRSTYKQALRYSSSTFFNKRMKKDLALTLTMDQGDQDGYRHAVYIFLNRNSAWSY